LVQRRSSGTGGPLHGALKQGRYTGRVGVRLQQVANAGTQRSEHDVGVRLCGQEHRYIGKFGVKCQRKCQGPVKRHPRAQDEDVKVRGILQLVSNISRARRKCAALPMMNGTFQRACGGGANAAEQTGVIRYNNVAAHL
jgi:hypothetical protein